MALTSMCARQHRRELVAVARQDVDHAAGDVGGGEHLARTPRPPAGASSRGHRDDRVARDQHGREARSRGRPAAARPARARRRRRSARACVKLKYGPATGFEEPTTCANLSAKPAYQTRRSIGPLDLRRARCRARRGRPRAPPASPPGGTAPARGCRRSPWPTWPARRAPPCTASRASLREPRATFWPSAEVRAARLGARERAADEELVRLLHRDAGVSRGSIAAAGRGRGRAGRPRGRSPTPCSRRTARRGRSG